MTIQVSNLSSTVTDAQLDNLKASFSSLGKVNKFEVLATNENTKVIVIQLESGEDVAIKTLNGQLLEGKPIEVKKISPNLNEWLRNHNKKRRDPGGDGGPPPSPPGGPPPGGDGGREEGPPGGDGGREGQ